MLGQFLLILIFLGLVALAFVWEIGIGAGGLSVLGLVFLPVAIKKTWGWLRKREQAAVQRRRDNAAIELSRSISPHGTSAQGYCLYLRPFVSTGHLPICVVASTMYFKYPAVVGKEQVEEHRDLVDLETLLAMAVSFYAPLVALGRPGEQVGAGRILTTEDSWRIEFSRLSAGARIIFLLPSSTPGTRWELREVIDDEHLLSKTVFLIPPAVGASDVHREAVRTFESEAGSDRLSLIGDLLKGDGIAAAGALFCFAQGGTALAFSSPLVSYAHPSLLRFLIDLWPSRETVVVSRSRFRKRIANAIDATTVRDSIAQARSARAAIRKASVPPN